jgi:hypothetical protein
MAIGTAQYLPLGITVYECRAPVRRRRVAAICALVAFVAVGFAMAQKTRGPIAMESADSQAASRLEDPVKSQTVQPVAEAAIPAPPVMELTAPPASEPVAVNAAEVEPERVPGHDTLSLPIVLRGAKTKPR